MPLPPLSRRRFIAGGSALLAGAGIPAWAEIFQQGLENLQYSRFWAREQKREPTPGPVNYIMESTDPPVAVEDMIKTMSAAC